MKFPGMSRDIVSFGFVAAVQGRARARWRSTCRWRPTTRRRRRRCGRRSSGRWRAAARGRRGRGQLHVTRPADARGGGAARRSPRTRSSSPACAHVVAVASGKGGVGKSTVAANLAVALGPARLPRRPARRRHLRPVGADDDRHHRAAAGRCGNRILPIEKYGIKLMSLGFILDADTPVIWRGPMVMKAIEQFLGDVEWGELDYLVIDLPPGTGDAQLTLTQKVPLAGAVIVTTPQDVALIDARKGLAMFRKVNVPVLGIVENMSTFVCPHCGETTDIFEQGGGERTRRAARHARSSARSRSTRDRRGRRRRRADRGRPSRDGPARRRPSAHVAEAVVERGRAAERRAAAALDRLSSHAVGRRPDRRRPPRRPRRRRRAAGRPARGAAGARGATGWC